MSYRIFITITSEKRSTYYLEFFAPDDLACVFQVDICCLCRSCMSHTAVTWPPTLDTWEVCFPETPPHLQANTPTILYNGFRTKKCLLTCLLQAVRTLLRLQHLLKQRLWCLESGEKVSPVLDLDNAVVAYEGAAGCKLKNNSYGVDWNAAASTDLWQQRCLLWIQWGQTFLAMLSTRPALHAAANICLTSNMIKMTA